MKARHQDIVLLASYQETMTERWKRKEIWKGLKNTIH